MFTARNLHHPRLSEHWPLKAKADSKERDYSIHDNMLLGTVKSCKDEDILKNNNRWKTIGAQINRKCANTRTYS